MDSEQYKLIQQAIREGLASSTWLMIITSFIAAGLGSFMGSYLKKQGENLAIRQSFEENLKQLERQTQATENIRSNITERIENLKASLQKYEKEDTYVRELYKDIKEYSSKQTQALRQAYLLLFEPNPSTANVPEPYENRLDRADEMIMQPLRDFSYILDEETNKKILSVHNELLSFRDRAEGLKKQDFFDKTEIARQFIKPDKIACRLGLISKPLNSS